jgi:predicted helicase
LGNKNFKLDDLYVRFFGVAERRIAEKTGRGVVCFVSNHSWLWYPSFVVMRERLLGAFDALWLDNFNGSKFETGKVMPDGRPDPSVFSTPFNREGSEVGTAVALLVWGAAKGPHPPIADAMGPSLSRSALPDSRIAKTQLESTCYLVLFVSIGE